MLDLRQTSALRRVLDEFHPMRLGQANPIELDRIEELRDLINEMLEKAGQLKSNLSPSDLALLNRIKREWKPRHELLD